MTTFKEAQEERVSRWDEIKHLVHRFEITKTPGYANFQYRAVTTDPEASALSSSDVMLIADSGNLCFGGRNGMKRQDGDKTIFTGVVHTD